MPSYNLLTKVNLGDVENTFFARKTLKIGPLETQDSNNVFIEGGVANINKLGLLSKTIVDFSYIVSKNNEGKLVWSTDNNISSWTFEEDVYLSKFNQNVNYVVDNELATVAYTNSFRDLINIPKTNDLILDSDRPFFLTYNSNLEDLINQNVDALKKSLELKELAFEPNELVIMKDISFSNLFMFGTSNQVGSLLVSGKNEIKRDYQTNETFWYNPIYNEDGTPKDVFVLGHSYKDMSTNNSVTCDTLNRMYEDTLYYINKKQHNLDIQRVQETISNMVQSGRFLVTESNLLDDGLDQSKCLENLDIGSISILNDDNVDFLNLSVINNGNITFTNIVQKYISSNNDSNLNDLFIKSGDEIGSFDLVKISSAQKDHYGFVKYVYDISSNDNDLNSVITWNYLIELQNELLSSLHYVQNSEFLYSFEDYNYDTKTFVDFDMSQFSNLSLEKYNEVYENLGLSRVSVTGDYGDLEKYPTSIHIFENDLPLLDRVNNCEGIDHDKMMHNLGLDNMCEQKNTNVNIRNGESFLQIVETGNNLYVYPNNNNISNKWLAIENDTHLITYKDLPIASVDNEGVVKKTNNYDYASYDTTVTISGIQEMVNELSSRLDNIDHRIRTFLTE